MCMLYTYTFATLKMLYLIAKTKSIILDDMDMKQREGRLSRVHMLKVHTYPKKGDLPLT